jgi:hypothetical protein
MQTKSDLIYRGILVILFIILLLIFHQYSENGRYIYHKEIKATFDDKYVVDTRTGTIYGIINFPEGKPSEFSYKIDLKTGKLWYMPSQVNDKLTKATTAIRKWTVTDSLPKKPPSK